MYEIIQRHARLSDPQVPKEEYDNLQKNAWYYQAILESFFELYATALKWENISKFNEICYAALKDGSLEKTIQSWLKETPVSASYFGGRHVLANDDLFNKLRTMATEGHIHTIQGDLSDHSTQRRIELALLKDRIRFGGGYGINCLDLSNIIHFTTLEEKIGTPQKKLTHKYASRAGLEGIVRSFERLSTPNALLVSSQVTKNRRLPELIKPEDFYHATPLTLKALESHQKWDPPWLRGRR